MFPTIDHVQSYVRYLRDDLQRAPSTVDGYGEELLLLVGRHIPLEHDALAAHLARLPDGRPVAPTTRNRRLAILRGFIRHLRDQQVLDHDPLQGVKRVKVPRARRLTYGADVLRTVVATLRTEAVSDRRTRDEAVLLLLFHTGLRVTELEQLQVIQVDLREHVLRRVRRKGGSATDIPLNAEVFAALDAWLAVRPTTTDWLFGQANGRRLGVRAIQKRLARLGVQAGLGRPLHPHALRHAHAMELLRGGTPTEVIRESLNHQSLATTQAYIHADEQLLREALDQLPPLRPVEAATSPDPNAATSG